MIEFYIFLRHIQFLTNEILEYKLCSGISLRRTHHKMDTLYKADKDFSRILYFSGQTPLNVISVKRTLP